MEINATLTADLAKPGHFAQKFPFGPAASYNLIYLTQDYAIEYDCESAFGVTNYCIHIMARNTTMPSAVEAQLIKLANETLALNPRNLPYVQTLQDGCPSPAR